MLTFLRPSIPLNSGQVWLEVVFGVCGCLHELITIGTLSLSFSTAPSFDIDPTESDTSYNDSYV